MLNPKAIKRLQESASHIAIVGRFTADPDSVGTSRTVPFSRARELINFGVYSKEAPIVIAGKTIYRARITVEPKEVKDPKADDAKAIAISGSALQRELQKLVETGEAPNHANIGGKIVAGLFANLDALMPFWHPNFDLLLIEGFYLARLPVTNGVLVDSAALRKVLYEPAFSGLLSSYLRAPQADAEGIFTALSKAYPGKQFRNGTASTEELKLRNGILADIKAYREWLQAAGDEAKGPYAMFGILADKQRKPDTVGGKVAERLRAIAIPRHDDPSITLKQIYAAYRVANEEVARVARSEQLMAFVTTWYFSAFAEQDPLMGLDPTEAHRMLYAENSRFVPTGIDTALAQELEDIFIESQWKEHRAKFGYDDSSPSASARASLELVRTAIAEHMVQRQPGRVFTSKQLLLWLGTSFSDLASKFVEGMRAIRERVEKAAELFAKAQKAIDRNFARKAEKGRKEIPAATAESLKAQLRTTFEGWDREFASLPPDEAAGPLPDLGLVAMLDKVLAASDGLSGDELCKTLLRTLAELEGIVQSKVIVEPIHGRSKAIDEHGRSLTNAYMRQSESARGVSVAGSATGGVKDPKVEPAVAQEQRVAAVATSGLPSRIPLPPPKDGAQPQSPFGDKENDLASYVPPDDENPGGLVILKGPPLTREELEALEVESDNKVLPGAIDRAVTELVDDQLLVAATKEQIASDKDLYGRKEEAVQRARLRALLFAEQMLAARGQDNVLDRADTSLLAEITLNTILHVGRDEGFNTGNFNALEKANLADKGFLDVPIWEILDAPSNDAALERLSEFLLQVRTQCDGVVKLTTYVGEMNDITALLNGLADRGGNGWITFVDDTIEGIVGKARNGDALPLLEVPVGGDAPPPGIVYVTRQAGGSDAIDLDGLFGKLTDGERSGLLAAAPGGGDATRLQLAPAGVKLGFPVFVGYDLASTHLPALSAKLNNHSGLVACASGKPAAVATGNLSRTLAMLMQQELDVIATEMETAGVVWKRYLTQRPDVLRTVIQSKLISVAIAHRQELVTAHGGNPNYKECLVAARVEIERLLGRFDLLERGLWVAAGDKWVEVGRTADGLAAVDKQFAIAVPAKAQSSEPKPTPTEPFQTDLIFGLL